MPADRTTQTAIRLYDALKRISSYMTPAQIDRDKNNIGLGYSEYLEMAYENMLEEAKRAIKGVRRPKENPDAG